MKRLAKWILWLLVVFLMIVAGYVGYVYLSYHRLPDNIQLSPKNETDRVLKPGTKYKAMTFNVGYGAYPHNYTFFMDGGYYSRAFSKQTVKDDINGFVDAVKSENPDIALFQEVDTDGDRSHHVNEVKWLQTHLPTYSSVFAQNYDSAYLFYPITHPIGKAKSGIVTIAKTKINDSTRYKLPIDTNFSKFFDLDRAISVTHIPVNNGKQLAVINVHLSAFTKNRAVQKAQLNKLFNQMTSEYDKGNYVMVGGDYNHDMLQDSPKLFHTTSKRLSWTHPFPIQQIPNHFHLVTKGLKAAGIPSVRNNNIPYKQGKTYVSFADGFMISDNVRADSIRVKNLKFAHSDHNPVVMQFELKK
ncbi:endonuclease/exonuclease/phosphatase family protein [Lentilactobacillus sp. Marseille-Q4993]|uniref:endonuclease/exonuclease/phosphatase family protein n=1 Tax=Lentilactobacillus sp. Marseille-Q4993 TaxID=3039492 RepID=UPI0024BC2CE2|nr:endonuclease/exonuclease/phosphatase family protein [Lentilactobacillus sp. Marseille-Q4993]